MAVQVAYSTTAQGICATVKVLYVRWYDKAHYQLHWPGWEIFSAVKLKRLLARLIKPATKATRPPCRLSEPEVLRLATAALGRPTPLVVQDVTHVADRTEWHIGTATIGSGTTLRIDDATGDVVEKSRWGCR